MEQQQLDKVNLVFKLPGEDGEELELPMRILVLSDLSCDEESEVFEEQEAVSVNKENFAEVLSNFNITLNFNVTNFLVNDNEAFELKLAITSMSSFSPVEVIQNVPLLTHFINFREVLVGLLTGEKSERLAGFIEDKSTQHLLKEIGIEKNISADDLETVSQLIAEIDYRMANQLNEILHNERFLSLESAWRSINFLVQRVDTSENIEIFLLNVSKQALMDSFEDAPEASQSSLFQFVYSREFGQFGGRPYSFIIGDYQFGHKTPDVRLLQEIASVASVAHAPFLAAASPELFSVDSFSDFVRVRDLASNFEQPQYSKWNSFRELPDSRYVGLTVPKFKLRDAYGSNDGESFSGLEYRETYKKGEKHGVWGNSAFAFASRLADSFAKNRWCLSVLGSEDGRVAGLELDGKLSKSNIPTQVMLSDRRESELVSCGFIPLCIHKGDNHAGFYSGHSTHFEKSFPDTAEGRLEAFSYRLSVQIPYLMIVCRFSHYLKVMQRENIGSWKTRSELERELNNWIRQYVSDMDNPAAGVRARRPLRNAQISVREIEGKAGWYYSSLSITPHVKYMGESFTLQEAGRLDKS